MNSEPGISKAQLEVWEWKEALQKEVEHLDIRAALHKRLLDSAKTVVDLGLASKEKTLRSRQGISPF